MTPPTRPSVGTSGAPGHDDLEEDVVERDLDEALMETFPASDPISITPEEDRPDQVDEALEESFPASDPRRRSSPARNKPRARSRCDGPWSFWPIPLEIGEAALI